MKTTHFIVIEIEVALPPVSRWWSTSLILMATQCLRDVGATG